MNKINVFMIMPYSEEFLENYKGFETKFSDKCIFNNAKAEGNLQNILPDIFQPLLNADLVLADLTGLNANVMYELGVAHSFNKKTIVITQDEINNLPFDLKQYRAIPYSNKYHNYNTFLKQLENIINGVINKTLKFSNPISDFTNSDKFVLDNDTANIEDKKLIDSSSYGFLDYNISITDNLNTITNNIMLIANDMGTLSDKTSLTAKCIIKIKNSGRPNVIKDVKSECTKLAFNIDNFSKQLTIYNKSNFELWEQTEKSIDGLLKNDFSYTPENKKVLIEFLKTLFSLPEIIENSNKSILEMQSSMNANKGIEQSLTKSITKASTQLDEYIKITNKMLFYIVDKKKKSNFITN